MTDEPTTLSWDELFQILLFLPASDLCHYAMTNSTAYDWIMTNQHLWTVLLKRDFTDTIEHWQQGSNRKTFQSSLNITSATEVSQDCCDEMKDYMCHYKRFSQFPFYPVMSRSMYDRESNQTISKILFPVCRGPLNLTVIDALINRQLVIPPDVTPNNQLAIDFKLLYMASRQPKVTPNLTFRLWMLSQNRFQTLIKCYFRETQCLVITVDPSHAWNEDTYDPVYSYSNCSNSLTNALFTLKDSVSYLKFEPPKACKGVLIVGVGVWSEAAPISKQRFLKDCAQMFDVLPLEYFELTCENAAVMTDVILRRFYTFHQQSTLKDAMLANGQAAPHEQLGETPTRCILS